jgi:hypothetical protein
MNRRRLAGAITAGTLGAALLFTVAKTNGWRLSDFSVGAITSRLKPRERTPEDAIYAMLDAARLADTQAYLGCYTGQLKDQLRQSVKESSPAKFADYLKASNAAVQGVALSPPEPVGDGLTKVRVEYVYRDRNEVQFVYLSREGSAWKITKVDGSERIKTLVPFGSPVAD